MIFYLSIAAIVCAVDQLTKYLAVIYLKPAGSVPIIENALHLTYTENTGAAFSILQGKTAMLAVVSLFAVAAFFLLIRSDLLRTRFAKFSLAVIAGGALGNLLDRVFRGFVVDMVDFNLIRFAIFNVADSFIVVGGILFVIAFIREEQISKRAGREKAENEV